MVKPQEAKEKKSDRGGKPLVWDCGSSLYDSFELKALELQLDSAIASRTLSMPHLSDTRVHPPQPLSKKSSKIVRSFHRLLRSFFVKPKQSNTSLFRVQQHSYGSFYTVYGTSGGLFTIPEVPETVADYDSLSPEIMPLRTTASDRFKTAATIIDMPYI